MIPLQPTIDDIWTAAQRLAGAVMKTPCVPSQTLSAIAGCELFLKFENLQFTASFKERGALNKLLSLTDDQRRAGVCAMSAGNHAQGVAYHARRLDVPAVIVMPKGTPLTKISRTRDHGAEVVVAGANLSEAFEIATERAERDGLTFVHPYDDPAVIAGQGTLAIEILQQVDNLDTVVVPIGGGGLISGILIAAKLIRPTIEVIGVQSETYPSMERALAHREAPIADGLTIAEGIAVKTAGTLTREIVRALVDDILLVDEASIERAVALLLGVEKTVVEGAGAAGLAAILQHHGRFAGKRVATLLTGGNIDLRVLSSVAMRELVRSGQLLRFEAPISDQPGAMAKLATILGDEGANIVDIAHDRLSLSLNAKGAVLDVVVEVQNSAHGDSLLCVLGKKGFNALRKPIG
jgi:threonine dehydratase